MEPILVHVSTALENNLDKSEMELLYKELTEKVNDLLLNNFALLVQILYRIDIDEKKLKATLLTRKDEAAGMVIADMIIKRIQNTIETRRHFKEAGRQGIDESLEW